MIVLFRTCRNPELLIAACVFDANGTMLRVTAVHEKPDAPYTVLG